MHHPANPWLGVMLASGLALTLGCSDTSEPENIRTPPQRFVATGLHIQERRGNRVLWQGHAQHAAGDLQAADVEDLQMHRLPQTPQQSVVTVESPRAHLAFGAGWATFHQVEISDPDGAHVDAGTAHYDEKEQQITADGPLHFTARNLTADAAKAIVHLDAGRVDLTGPIVGRWVPSPR